MKVYEFVFFSEHLDGAVGKFFTSKDKAYSYGLSEEVINQLHKVTNAVVTDNGIDYMQGDTVYEKGLIIEHEVF